jgi:hypothetical protein
MSVPFIDQNFPAHLQQFSSPGLDMPGFDAAKINQNASLLSSQQKVNDEKTKFSIRTYLISSVFVPDVVKAAATTTTVAGSAATTNYSSNHTTTESSDGTTVVGKVWQLIEFGKAASFATARQKVFGSHPTAAAATTAPSTIGNGVIVKLELSVSITASGASSASDVVQFVIFFEWFELIR